MSKITFISRMTIKEGQEAEFARICRELTADVVRNEPSSETIWFAFFKLRDRVRRYAVVERFASEAAEDAHMKSAWLGSRIASIVNCVEGTWEREYLDDLP